MNKIYLVREVYYDYYEFCNEIGYFDNLQKCYKVAHEYQKGIHKDRIVYDNPARRIELNDLGYSFIEILEIKVQ